MGLVTIFEKEQQFQGEIPLQEQYYNIVSFNSYSSKCFKRMNHEKKLNVTISNISTCLVLTCVTFLFPKRFTVVSFSSPLRREKVVHLQVTRSCGVLALHSIDRTGLINDASSCIRFAPVAHKLKKIKEIILQVVW